MHLIFCLLFILCSCQKIVETKRLKPNLDSKDLQILTRPPKQNLYKKRRVKVIKAEKQFIAPVFYNKISLTIHEHVPLKDILFVAAQKLGISLQMDRDIDTCLVYAAKDRAFIDIISDICSLANLRYEVRGSNIKIEADLPYFKNYVLTFLKFSRESENKITSVTDIFADKYSDTINTKDNGSDTLVSVKSSIDFWKELEDALKLILQDGKFAMHRQGGVISVLGTSKQHKQVEDYLKTLDRVSSKQVLIEAKVIEVNLNQKFRTGIDWGVFNKEFASSVGDHFKMGSNFTDILKDPDPKDFFTLKTDNFNFILKLLENFGSLRVMSSPRITVLNNQTALIKVAKNDVFFKVNYHTDYLGLVDRPRDGSPNERFRTYSSSEIRTKPIGFIMPIQVSINPNTNEVILFVRPTVSRRTSQVQDPAVEFNVKERKIDAPVHSNIPVVEVREIDSVLKLKNGQIAVLGGLMQVESSDEKSRFPGPTGFNPVNDLLGSARSTDHVIELVILLKAEVRDDEDDDDQFDEADERLMRCYANDPRPILR